MYTLFKYMNLQVLYKYTLTPYVYIYIHIYIYIYIYIYIVQCMYMNLLELSIYLSVCVHSTCKLTEVSRASERERKSE
jgi:hypothetical protein